MWILCDWSGNGTIPTIDYACDYFAEESHEQPWL
jgi:hypothetical protein